MKGGLPLAAECERNHLVDVEMFNRRIVAILGGVGNDVPAVGGDLEVCELREAQQVAAVGPIKLGPDRTVVGCVFVKGLRIELLLRRCINITSNTCCMCRA